MTEERDFRVGYKHKRGSRLARLLPEKCQWQLTESHIGSNMTLEEAHRLAAEENQRLSQDGRSETSRAVPVRQPDPTEWMDF